MKVFQPYGGGMPSPVYSPIKQKDNKSEKELTSTSHDFTKGPFDIATASNPSYHDPPFHMENFNNAVMKYKF